MFSSTKKESKEETRIVSNIIGKGAHLEGNLMTLGSLRVDGKIVGSIRAKSKVVLGSTAEIQGNVVAQDVEISGVVQGTLTVMGLLTLKPTAVVQGDICTAKLVFEEGAKFNGKCKMGEPLKEVVSQPAKKIEPALEKEGKKQILT